MNFIVIFCNRQYCAAQGKPLTWHSYELHETREAADTAAERLKRSLPALSVHVGELRAIRVVELCDGGLRLVEPIGRAA